MAIRCRLVWQHSQDAPVMQGCPGCHSRYRYPSSIPACECFICRKDGFVASIEIVAAECFPANMRPEFERFAVFVESFVAECFSEQICALSKNYQLLQVPPLRLLVCTPSPPLPGPQSVPAGQQPLLLAVSAAAGIRPWTVACFLSARLCGQSA